MTFKGHPESRRTGQYYDGFSGCEYIIDCTIKLLLSGKNRWKKIKNKKFDFQGQL